VWVEGVAIILARWRFWCQVGVRVVCVLCLHQFTYFCLVVFGFGDALLCCEVVCRCWVKYGVLTRCDGFFG
jgi:hypothetical protein